MQWRVVDGNRHLSFAALNKRAERLALALCRYGVTTETVVGLCFPASLENAMAVLAVVKSGGVYLPMDPAYPASRLSYLIRDSGASLVLTSLAGNLSGAQCPVMTLEAALGEAESEIAGEPQTHLGNKQGLYLIYTSGSTGKPKGTLVSHGAMANLVDWHQNRFQVQRRDRVALLAGPGFDASAWEFWTNLLTGSCLVVPHLSIRTDAAALLQWMTDLQITHSFCPTALAEALMMETPPPGLALKTLWTGGDKLKMVKPPSFPAPLVNLYGPSEATVISTWSLVPDNLDLTPPDIGGPIDNSRCYIVDAALRNVPVGVPGELVVGGLGLSRGYLNRPALTAEKFTPDPFASVPGSRLYHTGDRVRFLPVKGDRPKIAFLGRFDHQVQLRGYRIEPGEIETLLMNHPDVKQALVLVIQPEGDLARLVGFVQCGQEPFDGEGVGLYLRDKLPDYMVPSQLISLKAFPMTANGKVDRAQLRRQALNFRSAPKQSTTPGNPVEASLVRIWSEVLGVAQVAPEDNFFALGGHSLLATRLVTRIKRDLGLALPLRVLFERPTVKSLAQWVDNHGNPLKLKSAAPLPDPVTPAVVPLPRPRRSEWELSFSQQRLWFIDRLQPGNPAFNIPLALRLKGPLAVASLKAALTKLNRRHDILRTRFDETEGQALQVVYGAQPVPFKQVNLTHLSPSRAEAEALRLARVEAGTSFHLTAASCWRCTLLTLSNTDRVLLLTFHHIIADGWSLEVFLGELERAYRAEVRDLEEKTPELPLQYGQYAARQRRDWGEEPVDELLEWWRNQLSGCATLDLPTDRPRPVEQSFNGAMVDFKVPQPIAEKITTSGSGRRHHALYGVTGGVSNPFTSLQRPKRYCRGYSGRQSGPIGMGAHDRLLCEYFGHAWPLFHRSVLRRPVAAGEKHGIGVSGPFAFAV